MTTHRGVERRRLKYAATINDETLGEETDADYELQYVDIGNVDSSGTIDETPTYRFADAPSRARRRVRNGDVIISCVRTYLQSISPIHDPPDNLIVSTGFAVVRPLGAVLDAAFAKYALRESAFLAEVEMRSVGVSYPAINASDLGDIPIHLPSPNSQGAIAGYLDRETARLDALVAAKERVLGLLAEKRRALITRAVIRGLDPGAPLRDSGIPWLGDVPAHWRLMRLKFVVTKIEQGWSPECYSTPATGEEWGVLKAGCCNGGVFNPEENKALPPDLDVPTELEVSPGNVLMSRASGSTELIGSVAQVPVGTRARLLLSDKTYRLWLTPGRFIPPYIVAALGSHLGRFQIQRVISGAAGLANNLAQGDVKEFLLLLPTESEQRVILAHLDDATGRLDALRAATERTIALLRERRAALIAAAVTGQIEVEAAG